MINVGELIGDPDFHRSLPFTEATVHSLMAFGRKGRRR